LASAYTQVAGRSSILDLLNLPTDWSMVVVVAADSMASVRHTHLLYLLRKAHLDHKALALAFHSDQED
jgi:hypothetical protein